jgi:hypothetical protein
VLGSDFSKAISGARKIHRDLAAIGIMPQKRNALWAQQVHLAAAGLDTELEFAKLL